MSEGLMYFVKRWPWSSISKEANPEREGVKETPLSDWMLAAKALNTNIIKNSMESCKQNIIRNFLLFKVSLNSHLVIVVNFIR
jgi:hypothetical protein